MLGIIKEKYIKNSLNAIFLLFQPVVNGGYTQWTSYGVCSKTCGKGEQTRKRTCTNPSPAHGGQRCSGPSTQDKSCKLRECPIDGGYVAWSPFEPCSVTCGSGLQARKRTCTNPVPLHGGKKCQGASMEEKKCHPRECPSKY